jgi:hypothetical protein
MQLANYRCEKADDTGIRRRVPSPPVLTYLQYRSLAELENKTKGAFKD